MRVQKGLHLCTRVAVLPRAGFGVTAEAMRKDEGDGPRCVPPGVQHCVPARCSHQTSRGTRRS